MMNFWVAIHHTDVVILGQPVADQSGFAETGRRGDKGEPALRGYAVSEFL